MGILADIRRRRRAGIHDDCHRAGVESLITGMRHRRHRHAVGVIIGKQRRQQIGFADHAPLVRQVPGLSGFSGGRCRSRVRESSSDRPDGAGDGLGVTVVEGDPDPVTFDPQP